MTRFDWFKFMDAVKLKRDCLISFQSLRLAKSITHKITTYRLNNIPAASFSDFNKLPHPHTTQFNFRSGRHFETAPGQGRYGYIR